jgi:hypothetical protein
MLRLKWPTEIGGLGPGGLEAFSLTTLASAFVCCLLVRHCSFLFVPSFLFWVGLVL